MIPTEELHNELQGNLAMVHEAMKVNQYYLECLHNLLRAPKSEFVYRELGDGFEKIMHTCSVAEENFYTLEQMEKQYRKMIDLITGIFP